MPKGELKIEFCDSSYGPMLLLVSEDSPVKHQLLPGDVVRGVKVDGVTLNEASGWRNKDGLERLLWESQDRKRHLVVSKEASYTTPRTEFSGQPAHSFFSNKYVFPTYSRSRSLTAGFQIHQHLLQIHEQHHLCAARLDHDRCWGSVRLVLMDPGTAYPTLPHLHWDWAHRAQSARD